MTLKLSTEKWPRIGLALSGGSARGIAHVGVLKALAEHEIPVSCVAGTSAGAIVAGAFASGMPLAEIETMGRTLRWRDLGRMTMSRLGVQVNDRLESYLRERFPITRFEDLAIPLAVVATDLKSGAAVVMRDEGDIPFAIRASCAIPGWYVPVTDSEGRQLVDGGLVAGLPTTMARELGAELVIAVDVNAEGATFIGPTHSIISVLLQSMLVVQKMAGLAQLELADCVISPRLGHIRWDEISRGEEFMAAGYEAAIEAMPKIRESIESLIDARRKWYQPRRKRESTPRSA
ncbi:MAG TPA: patatin-like phospholipase family protein [Pyrinomonadaceae bacterium]|nr:patatin-like phospholipase family protein [Pyrinomonadaceae bacterium]